MLTFRGGREVQGYPVSNKHAVSEISESLGLGIDQFMVWQSRYFLYALIKKIRVIKIRANIFTMHIAAPIYLLCLCCAYVIKYMKIHM